MPAARGLQAARVFLLLGLLCGIAAAASLYAGRTDIPFGRILRILFFHDGSVQECNIIFKIRLPRMLMALLLGGALSLSGFLLQTYFQNPIAGPFVLGISSGAKLFVAITMLPRAPGCLLSPHLSVRCFLHPLSCWFPAGCILIRRCLSSAS